MPRNDRKVQLLLFDARRFIVGLKCGSECLTHLLCSEIISFPNVLFRWTYGVIVATRSDDVIFLESHLSLSCSFAIDDMVTSVDREI